MLLSDSAINSWRTVDSRSKRSFLLSRIEYQIEDYFPFQLSSYRWTCGMRWAILWRFLWGLTLSLFASLSLDVLPKVTSVFPIDSNRRYEHLHRGCDLKIDLEPGAVGGFFCCGKTVSNLKNPSKNSITKTYVANMQMCKCANNEHSSGHVFRI